MTSILNPQQHSKNQLNNQWSNIDRYRAIEGGSADNQRPDSVGFGQPDTDRFDAPLMAPHYYDRPQVSTAAPQRVSVHAAGVTAIDEQPIRLGRRVDQGRFWVGSVLTSGVAALAGVIGMVIAQDLLRVPLSLASIGLDGAHVATYGLLAALIALLAAGAYDGMLAFAPRPTVYFSWITGLLVALAVLLPFTAPVAVASQVALALINLVVGVSIMVLVPVAASNARVR